MHFVRDKIAQFFTLVQAYGVFITLNQRDIHYQPLIKAWLTQDIEENRGT